MAIKSKANANSSPAARESIVRQIAMMDWQQIPSATIREAFGNIAWSTLHDYRETDVYKEELENLKTQWREDMNKLPTTKHLRDKVSLAMTLGLQRLIDVLVAGTPKDQIAAARLVAQMDGRFISGNDKEDGQNPMAQTVASELLTAIERHNKTVN